MYGIANIHLHTHTCTYMYKPDTYVSAVQCTKVFMNTVNKYVLCIITSLSTFEAMFAYISMYIDVIS